MPLRPLKRCVCRGLAELTSKVIHLRARGKVSVSAVERGGEMKKERKKAETNFRTFEEITWQPLLLRLSPLLHLQKINAEQLQLYRRVAPSDQ